MFLNLKTMGLNFCIQTILLCVKSNNLEFQSTLKTMKTKKEQKEQKEQMELQLKVVLKVPQQQRPKFHLL